VIDRSRAKTVIGLAGTITALAAWQLGLRRYDATRTHHAQLQRTAVERALEQLASVGVEQRRALLAEAKRADTIVPGACVLLTVMRELAIEELTVSETDILDGLCESA
jgi:exopolyphosphatase/guanosine-5'-triphosphate,3'-diphosphate pyrophosphatase